MLRAQKLLARKLADLWRALPAVAGRARSMVVPGATRILATVAQSLRARGVDDPTWTLLAGALCYAGAGVFSLTSGLGEGRPAHGTALAKHCLGAGG